MAERPVTTYTRVKHQGWEGGTVAYQKRCGHCSATNRFSRRVCRMCGYSMRKPQRKKKPERGSIERLRLELAHAAKKSDEWMTKVKAATTNAHYWSRRERALAEKLADRRASKPTSGEPVRAIKFAPKE